MEGVRRRNSFLVTVAKGQPTNPRKAEEYIKETLDLKNTTDNEIQLRTNSDLNEVDTRYNFDTMVTKTRGGVGIRL